MSIGERITELRKNSGLSQGQLADIMDVSRQAVSKWETDQASPDTINLIRLSDVLNADVEYLASGKKAKPKFTPIVINYEYTPKNAKEKIVEKIVEKVVEVEKIVEIEKPVEVEKIVERIVEKPIIKRVVRTKYKNNLILTYIVGAVCFTSGLLIGLLF